MANAPTSISGLKTRLESKDGEILIVSREAALRSIIIGYLFEDVGETGINGDPVPIPEVNANILRKVMEWCEHHKTGAFCPSLHFWPSTERESTDPPPSDALRQPENRDIVIEEWDQNFFKIDQQELFEIILAANYLDIQHLLDMACKTVADMINGKTPEEIRKTFNIVVCTPLPLYLHSLLDPGMHSEVDILQE